MSRGHRAGALQVCISANKAADSQATSALRCIQQILLTTVQEEARALLCILLEILQTAEQRKHTARSIFFLNLLRVVEALPRVFHLCLELCTPSLCCSVK